MRSLASRAAERPSRIRSVVSPATHGGEGGLGGAGEQLIDAIAVEDVVDQLVLVDAVGEGQADVDHLVVASEGLAERDGRGRVAWSSA